MLNEKDSIGWARRWDRARRFVKEERKKGRGNYLREGSKISGVGYP